MQLQRDPRKRQQEKSPLPRANPEIPTSTFSDIAFLLVTFFLLTMAAAMTQGLDFQLPEPEDDRTEIEPVEAVHVKVLTTGGLWVDGRSMRLEELLAYLAPKLAVNPDKPVIVETDPAAPYRHMVAALDELRQGKERLKLAQDIQIAMPTRSDREALGW